MRVKLKSNRCCNHRSRHDYRQRKGVVLAMTALHLWCNSCFMPRPHRVGTSCNVCLSVPYLTLIRGRKALASRKLARAKHMTRVTRDPIWRSKGQRSRSLGRLMPWPKISHTFGTERPTNFKLGVRTEYDNPHRRRARWPQRSKRSRSPDINDLGGSSILGTGAFCGALPHSLF